jgi:hypothetical protein
MEITPHSNYDARMMQNPEEPNGKIIQVSPVTTQESCQTHHAPICFGFEN